MTVTFSPCGPVCAPEVCRPCPDYSRVEVYPRLWVGGGNQPITSEEFDLVLSLDPIVAEFKPAPPSVRELASPFPDADAPPLDVLDRLASAIDEATARSERVLVRCFAGMNRSPLVVAYWLITRGHMSPTEAIERLRTLRACLAEYPLSNEAFVAQLESLEPRK